MKKIIIFTLLLLLTTLPSTAKGIKTHMDGMRQHGGARSAIPSVMVDQESAYVTVEISRYSGEYAIYISDEYGVPLSNTNGIVEGRTYSILETEDLPIGNYTSSNAVLISASYTLKCSLMMLSM